jgi:hypothetical protein
MIFIINLSFFFLGLMVPGLCLFLVGFATRLLKLDD